MDLKNQKVIVLFSGGLDSTVALYWVRAHRGNPIPLTINYTGRPEAEKRAVHQILEAGKFPKAIEVDIPFYKDAESSAQEIGPASPLHRVSPVYLPAKNILFYAIALYYAELYSAPYLIGGHYKADAKRFPDVSQEFFDRFNTLLQDVLATLRNVRILTPFLSYDKQKLIQLGHQYAIPFQFIWSCYHDGADPCGTCEGCRELHSALLDKA